VTTAAATKNGDNNEWKDTFSERKRRDWFVTAAMNNIQAWRNSNPEAGTSKNGTNKRVPVTAAASITTGWS